MFDPLPSLPGGSQCVNRHTTVVRTSPTVCGQAGRRRVPLAHGAVSSRASRRSISVALGRLWMRRLPRASADAGRARSAPDRAVTQRSQGPVVSAARATHGPQAPASPGAASPTSHREPQVSQPDRDRFHVFQAGDAIRLIGSWFAARASWGSVHAHRALTSSGSERSPSRRTLDAQQPSPAPSDDDAGVSPAE